jgi:predicted transcriptional regulator of viral defense system
MVVHSLTPGALMTAPAGEGDVMTTPFQPDLERWASRQAGLVTRRQALDAGYTPRELRTLVKDGGAWVTVRRGIYLHSDAWDDLAEDGRWWLRDRAADLSMARAHVLSHDSAARGLGLKLLAPTVLLSHITRPGVGGSRTDHGVKHHLAKVPPISLSAVDGVRVTGLARTALDIAREHGFAAGVVTMDSARRAGATLTGLRGELKLMRSRPGVNRARAAVDFSDQGAESPGESLARILISELGIGAPETQFPVRLADGRVVWGDLRVGCHVFEFDGRIKYQRASEGGLATKDPGDVVWEEKKRQDATVAEGLGMSRIIWDDLFGQARDRAKIRLRGEHALTVVRHGKELPAHLQRFSDDLMDERMARIRHRTA